jgi:hypothetical protein
MKDDHDDDHKELAINLRTAVAKSRVTYLSAAISCQWLCPKFGAFRINDKKIHQKRRMRALFLPQR